MIFLVWDHAFGHIKWIGSISFPRRVASKYEGESYLHSPLSSEVVGLQGGVIVCRGE